jgi:hypothetical protein
MRDHDLEEVMARAQIESWMPQRELTILGVGLLEDVTDESRELALVEDEAVFTLDQIRGVFERALFD